MAELKINHALIGPSDARALMDICPFDALELIEGRLALSAGCKMCGLCVKKGPKGLIELVQSPPPRLNKDEWRGVAVLGDCASGRLHLVSLELMGKARELAAVTGHPVYAVVIGSGVDEQARELLHHGADEVFVYDSPQLEHFTAETYTEALCDFALRLRPSCVLVGATAAGRSLAPRAAARLRTGLTADCTSLEMKQNSDLVQIRPAFGGNIMAQIVTAHTRPQFCTVRYKIFAAPARLDNPAGKLTRMKLPPLTGGVSVLGVERRPTEVDISEAEMIVAAGRGVKSAADLNMLRELAGLLGAQLACTRPLIENGWMGPKKQIGLSGRTVKPKLLIAAGISGSVQFAAGMKGADCIVAINSDRRAPIFDIAHHGFCGDLYDIVPRLISMIRGAGV